MNVRDAVALFGVCLYIKFILCVDGQESVTQQLAVTGGDRNVFQVLMSAQKTFHLPSHPSSELVSSSKKQELNKDMIVWLTDSNVGWQSDCLDTGSKFAHGITWP